MIVAYLSQNGHGGVVDVFPVSRDNLAGRYIDQINARVTEYRAAGGELSEDWLLGLNTELNLPAGFVLTVHAGL